MADFSATLLDYDTKRAKGTALFVVEMLPAETILYSVLLAAEHRGKSKHAVKNIKNVLMENNLLQIGGEETTGKGWCWASVEVKHENS